MPKIRNLDHSIHWRTPKEFYEKLNAKYKFLFDPCPYQHNLKEWDGLEENWKKRNYCNPGYDLKLKTEFVLKGISESKKAKLCVFLLPVSTSTKLFHDHIKPNAKKIIFLKGRLPFEGVNSKGQIVNCPNVTKKMKEKTILHKYIDKDGKLKSKRIPKYIKNSGQHDSMVVVFDGRK